MWSNFWWSKLGRYCLHLFSRQGRDAAKVHVVHKIVSAPISQTKAPKNYLAQNVSSAEAKKPWAGGYCIDRYRTEYTDFIIILMLMYRLILIHANDKIKSLM